ncbi:MAG: hypothetical protein FWG64_02850 [Firmicutes bacterium]|nr:hypothetical protein [Bacillota bacterium]
MDRFLTVKTVITFALVATLCYMTVTERALPNEFVLTLGTVITYFFTKRDPPAERAGDNKTVEPTTEVADPQPSKTDPPAERAGKKTKTEEEEQTTWTYQQEEQEESR